MNFFRSILSEEPDPPEPQKPQSSVPKSPSSQTQDHDDDDDDDDVHSDQSSPQREEISSNTSSAADGAGGWSFGGLMKTLATRSESVIEIYRRDLKEFQAGLQKETEVIREVASRAVKDLPSSIEVGASVAQGSLETMGHAIDGVWKSTAEVISQGKEALLAQSDGESDSDTHNYSNQSSSSRRYSRFDAQLRAIQNDDNTYCKVPEDLEDYNKWTRGFVLEEKSKEVLSLVEENGTIEGIYKRVVPNVVDPETFWCRYFYRVHKLKQQEDARAKLVNRAISIDDDEELTWDVEDDDDDDEESSGRSKSDKVMEKNEELGTGKLLQVAKEETPINEPQVMSSNAAGENIGNKPTEENVDKVNVTEVSTDKAMSQVQSEQTSEVKNTWLESKPDEKVASDGKIDNGGSCKDSDVSIVSTQPSLPEEEDLGWDEIEDLGSNDESKPTHSGGSNRADLRKRLSAADDDEDLSWDIEDDDEPVTKPGTK